MIEKETRDEKKFGNYFLLGAVVAALLVFLFMIRVFILPMILAVVIAIMVYPLYGLVLKTVKNKRSIASLICCFIVVITLLVPLAFMGELVVSQSIELYRGAAPQIDELMQKVRTGAVGRVVDMYADKWFPGYGVNIEFKPVVLSVLEYLSSHVPNIVNKFSRTTASLVFNAFIIIFSLFYFLRDGEQLVPMIKDLVPISAEYKEKLITGFNSMTNAIVKGVLLIALLQSFLATLTLWIFGVKAWLLWGMIMLVLSVIPFVGTGTVLVPAGIIKMITGDIWQGLLIILISVFIISLVDNVLRPRIIGRDSGMHDLLVFFSIIGGIYTFGPAGLVIGPLIAAVFLTMVAIYKIEYKSRIDASE